MTLRGTTTGFTLELDGNPDEVARILGAVGTEMEKIRSDNAARDLEVMLPADRWPFGYRVGHLNVRGVLHLRESIGG